MSNSKNSNRDLDWFYFENKLYDYVTKRLEPVLKQIKQTSDHNDYQDHKIQKMKEAQAQLHSWFTKLEKKQNEQNEIRDNLNSLKQQVRGHDILHHENQGKFNTLFGDIKEKLKSNEEDLHDFEGSVATMKMEVTAFNQKLIDHKAFYNNEINDAKNLVVDSIADMDAKVKKLELKTDYDQGIRDNQKEDIDQMMIDINILKER